MTDTKSRAKESTTVKNSTVAKNSGSKKEPKTSAADSDQNSAAVNEKKSRRKSRAGGYFIFSLFVLFLILVAALAYWFEKQQQELASHTREQIEQLRQQVKPELEQLTATSRQLQEHLASQEKQQQALTEAFGNLLKTRRHLRNDWLLAEADYLLRLASHRLLLARDVGSALAAIQAADERLHDMTDPAVIPLRGLLAKDINRLKAVPEPDIAGLSAQLSALAHGLDSLPLLSAYTDSRANHSAANALDTNETRVKDWKQLPEAIWGDIKKLLVIRERHGRVIPLLSPRQHFFLIQNLKLKLEQARLALLNAEPDIYQERLQSAIDWIHDFFKQDDPATQAMLKQIKQLAGENIKPDLPDISASYRALQDFIEKQNEKAKRAEDPA
ncbi:Uncharacterized protein EC-HemX [hydrothermal vent metagenome]|uniref:Uncharacterized protein EC-HemX n=1 Tax=hydrothermal vent metagenome TaxID=652676 RepID=A0A3B1BQV6_9ZZZZ